MRLHRLRLVNFRQHADTEIVFGPGITGIIGPNGSGKTSLLEALAWAIYGNPAARGDKDSIRNLRAKPRATVRVELEFGLPQHEYRVVRGLHTAELYQDNVLVANALKEVTDKLERILGMRHDEFFNTYFTGQKELAVMAALGPTERGAFLSRVLGYDRLRLAQDKVREVRNALAAELRGLEAALPDPAVLAAERRDADGRLGAARDAARAADATRRNAEAELGREEPRWNDWVARRERTLSLNGERRMAEHAVEAAKQEFQRLDKELRQALRAREQLQQLAVELEPIARLKQELAGLELLQRDEAARQAEQAQLEELTRTIGGLERRITELADVERALARAEQEARALEARLQAAEQLAEEQRAAWVREKEYAAARRTELLKQHDDVKEQRDRIAKLGPEGECPTCRRPLGDEFAEVLGLLDRQLQAIIDDGKYFRQRMEQLAALPEGVAAAERQQDAVREESRRASEREGALQAQAAERARAAVELAALRIRARDIAAQVRARRGGYDAARHDVVRGRLAQLQPIELEAAGLDALAKRAETLVRDAEEAERTLSERERRAAELVEVVKAEGFSDARFRAAKERYDRALGAVRAAELAVVEARGDLTRAEQDVREAERREAERAARERQIAELKSRVRLHTDLDRAFAELRAELNAEMRPEIAELASGFLGDLTDGRYAEVELTEHYDMLVLDDGVPKPVISGGEEDIAHLVVRLAISQMIAARAGQPLEVLVLDEIFGSLDETRRQHVLALLRRLGDRFPQVVLITHIEQVREGLDRVIRVEYDATHGTSVVRDDTAVIGATDASVAA